VCSILVRAKYALTCEIAVTLDGTVIHKSGLITGGKSSHNTGKKWEEKEVQGSSSLTANRGNPLTAFPSFASYSRISLNSNA